MAKYEVICQARATIREVWHVEASGADEAREIMEDCPWRGGVGVEFVSQGVEGDEDERIIQAVLELPAAGARADLNWQAARDAAPELLAVVRNMVDAFAHYCAYGEQSDDEDSALDKAHAILARIGSASPCEAVERDRAL